MNLSNLKPAKGSVKSRKRIARGQGSGMGGTSTKGHKGAKSRAGYNRKRNFEGGQMPIQMRLPKRGFKNRNRVDFVPLNLGRLQQIIDKYKLKKIDPETLVEKGIIQKDDLVKILGKGELTSPVKISAHAVSKGAKEAIEAKGGSVTIL